MANMQNLRKLVEKNNLLLSFCFYTYNFHSLKILSINHYIAKHYLQPKPLDHLSIFAIQVFGLLMFWSAVLKIIHKGKNKNTEL